MESDAFPHDEIDVVCVRSKNVPFDHFNLPYCSENKVLNYQIIPSRYPLL